MPKIIVIMDKYSYMRAYENDQIKPRLISEESLTVPDLVMSMADIYRKYAVTGDISSLPGVVRPIIQDNGDIDDDPLPESEELTDTLLESRRLREQLSQKKEVPVQEPPKTDDKSDPQDQSADEERSDDDKADPKD